MTFIEALNAAMDTPNGRDYIDRVKNVVREQLQELDQTAVVEDTHYFNHSAIPDFSLSWPGESGRRNVFLRDSYESIRAGNDEGYLAALEPVFISLDATREDRSADESHSEPSESYKEPPSEILTMSERARRPRSPRTLVTDVAAVDVLLGGQPADASPLGTLVRANFVRGARGHIDRQRAEQLIRPRDTSSSNEDRSLLIRDSFAEDAALRITRTAQLIDLAMADAGDHFTDSAMAALSGKLSLAELRSLLPWLLAQPKAASNRAFWRELGQMMTFGDLERIRDSLGTLDLTPLIKANSDVWTVNWSYLGLSTPRDNSSEDQLHPSLWSFTGGRLCADVGEERLQFAKNGQLVGSRPASSAARWADVADSLTAYRLSGVALQGIRRSVSIDAGRSDDIRRDIEEVTASLDDEYFVTHVRMRVPAPGKNEGTSEIEVDFGAGVVKSSEGASIQSLLSVLGRVLKYRNPLPPEIIEELT